MHLFNVGDSPHRDAASTAQIGVPQPCAEQHFTTSGEIRAWNQLQQFVVAEIGLADQSDQTIHDFAQVVRGNAGGHSHRDPGAAVEQQERELGRQHRGLLLGTVEVGSEVDGVIADLFKQGLMSDGCQPRFGVSHGGRGVVVHRSEVSMTIQQWMAARKGLNQANKSVVNRLVAMGVILAEHVSDDSGTFPVRTVRSEAEFLHRVEDAPLNRLQSVAGIRQSSAHDHAHGVFEVGALHLLMQGDRLNALLSHLVR